MAENTTNNEPVKEEAPQWAQNLQNSLSELAQTIKESLSPSATETTPQQDPTQPIEIVLPQEPQQDPTPSPEEVETEEQHPQEKPKKKSFLSWLL